MDKVEREAVAANAVVASLSDQFGWVLTTVKWDDGSADRMHDFNLEGDGHRIALEVSTIADGQRVGRDVRWDRKAPHQLIPVAGLEGVWTASAASEAEVDDVVAAVTEHVPALAALGHASVDTRTWQNHAFTPADDRPPHFVHLVGLSRAGVTDVSKIVNPSEELITELGGRVHVLRSHGHTRPADRNYPVNFLNEQLGDPDLHASDVAKLAAADGTARHLWLWVEWHEGSPILRSFDVEGLPTDDIDSVGLDGLWLGWGASSERVAGAYWLRGRGWYHLDGPMVRNL